MKPLKVKELIALLENCNPDCDVEFQGFSGVENVQGLEKNHPSIITLIGDEN